MTILDTLPAPLAHDHGFSRPDLRIVAPSDPVADLTPREREVLSLMAEGHANQAICRQLYISPKTLERHVQHIFTKLGLPPSTDQHRRVCAVLAWLRSPLGSSIQA